ncbi:MAG: hypothetical protein C0507_17875 [Cyanobacteria bacterium PR.3.49]|nr:hypothetical protein [Cyanobacteria bacterium PR.3.49]
MRIRSDCLRLVFHRCSNKSSCFVFHILRNIFAFALGIPEVKAVDQSAVEIRRVRRRQEDNSAALVTGIQVCRNTFLGTGCSQHVIAFREEVGADNGAPFDAGLCQVRGEFRFIAFIGHLNVATVRDGTHVASISFG